MKLYKLSITCLIIAVTGCMKNDNANLSERDKLSASSNEMIINTEPQTQFIGSVVGFNNVIRSGGGPSPTAEGNTLYNLPLFKSSTQENDWWDNLVEEFAYSGQDFFAANCRGYSPNVPTVDHGDPRKLPLLVQAMNRRGVGDQFKIAVFDDCPASWCANRNVDHGLGYNNSVKFDCGDSTNYKYIWDYNIKTAFLNIPNEKRFKFNNRPVIFFWSVNTGWAINFENGNLKKILQYVRQNFVATFGQNPFLVIDRSWLDRDPTVNDNTVIDGIDNWFTTQNPWTMYTFNGLKIGSGVAGFKVVKPDFGINMFIDANHGNTLINTLNKTVGDGATLTLLEGFTDCAENASLFRSKDLIYYDYPNQRINILRSRSKDPYPTTLKVEAEGCDYFYDVTPGNSGNQFREGDIDVVKTGDVNGGWHVTAASQNEWLEWKELPFKSGTSNFQLRYSSNQAATVMFSVDGVDLPPCVVPISGNGVYSTINAGNISFANNSLHTVRLKIVSGSLAINYFNRVSI